MDLPCFGISKTTGILTTADQIQGFAPHTSGSSLILIFHAAVRLWGVFNTNPENIMTNTIDQSRNAACKLKNQLQVIINNEPASIAAYVATEALYYNDDDPVIFFTDLQRSGCQSGMIGGLIYYYDTHAFFDRYYDEIEELREDYEDSVGEPLRINGDLKNWLAWFAFEETAFCMANDLKLDI